MRRPLAVVVFAVLAVACSDLPTQPEAGPTDLGISAAVVDESTFFDLVNPDYTPVDLGALPGNGQALDRNAEGTVVGTYQDPVTLDQHGWMWTQTGVVELTTSQGYRFLPSTINDLGQVAGTVWILSDVAHNGPQWLPHAAIREVDGSYRILFDDDFSSYAVRITETGTIYGTWRSLDPEIIRAGYIMEGSEVTFVGHKPLMNVRGVAYDGSYMVGEENYVGPAFFWTPSGGYQTFDSSMLPWDVNSAGQMVGRITVCPDSGCTWQAVRASATDLTLSPLAFLHPFSVATAYGINEAGVMVGDDWMPDDSFDRIALVWTDPLTFTLLRGIGGAYNHAQEIEEDGTILGSATDADGVYHAVMWTLGTTSAAEILTQLMGQVDALQASGALNKGQANSLMAKLNGILARVGSDNVESLLNRLNAFRNEVNALYASGKLSEAERDALLTLAADLAVALQGG